MSLILEVVELVKGLSKQCKGQDNL
jgi:hypothetical protein